MIIYINPEWNFKETVINIETLKYLYNGVLTSFSYKEIKLRNKFIREVKENVYKLKFEEWKRDKIWNYLNDYEEKEILEIIANIRK